MNNSYHNLLITSIGHFLVHSMTMILPVILVVLEKEFSISLIELGQLATIQIMFLGLGGIPSGILVDYFGEKKVLIIYFFGLLVSSLWLFFSQTFIMVALGLGFLGLIAGLYHPAGLKIVSNSIDISKFMSYHGVSGSLGLAFGPIYGSLMTNLYGWRIAYLFLGLFAIFGLISLIKYDGGEKKILTNFNIRIKFSSAQILIIIIASLWGLAHHGLFNFLPYYFKDTVKTSINPILASGMLTGFVLILGVFGQLFGGVLGTKFKRKNIYILVIGLNIPFLIMMGYNSGLLLIIITGLLGAINFMFQPINNSLLADVTDNDRRGTVYGFSAGISFSIGSLSGIIGGYLGDFFSINYIFPVLTIFLIPAVILSIILNKML